MKKYTSRKFRSRTIVIKKASLSFLMLPVGIAAAILLISRMPPLASSTADSADIAQMAKLCIGTAIPGIEGGDRSMYNAFFGDITHHTIGFDITAAPTIIAGQLPAVRAASGDIRLIDTAPSEQPAPDPMSDAAVRAASPTPSPSAPAQSPAANTDSGDMHPIVEVSLISGGTRNNAGYNKDIYVDNFTDFAVDIPKILDTPLNISPVDGEPFVLIVHTHTTESYTPAGQDTYQNGDSTRTQDPSANVVRVGDEITDQLRAAGVNVIHDKTINDYPSYNGSYKKTLGVIEYYLDKYPSIQIVLDIHRDGMTKQDGTKLKVCADVNGEKSAQIQLVLGSSQGGLTHENWRENLKLGLRVQDRMTRDYPGLARPLALQKERYNMHATYGSMIVEVGTDGNTLEEAIVAGRYVGKALGAVIGSIE